jgi:AcrR family transcriptional regulator
MPKTEKSKHTKAKILHVAKDLFANKGFNYTSVKDITSVAGLGYGTFYLYFKDKKEVFYALLELVEDDLYTASNSQADIQKNYPRGRESYRALRKDLRAICLSFFDNRSILKFSKELALIDNDFKIKYKQMRYRLIQRTKTILEKSGVENMDLDIAAVAIAGMIEAAATQWTSEDDSSVIDSKLQVEKLIPTLTKIYFKIVS